MDIQIADKELVARNSEYQKTHKLPTFESEVLELCAKGLEAPLEWGSFE